MLEHGCGWCERQAEDELEELDWNSLLNTMSERDTQSTGFCPREPETERGLTGTGVGRVVARLRIRL